MNNNLDKIISTILEDAKRQSEEKLGAAEALAAEILEAERKAADKQNGIYLDKVRADCDERKARALSSAASIEKNVILKAKVELLDAAFEKALKELCALKGAAFISFCEALYYEAAENAEAIVLVSEDKLPDAEELRSAFEAISLKRFGNSGKFTFRADRRVDGGFILVYGEIYVNCTVSSALASLRPKLEAKAAEILFA